MCKARSILLLGGTDEAVRLNSVLAGHSGVKLVTSLAGRTRNPAQLTGETVVGGFGGQQGLKDFILERQIDIMIDASHPFADRITQNAFAACGEAGIIYIRLQRPEWERQPEDNWISVASIEEAAKKLADYNRIFLTVGRQELAVFKRVAGKFFLVRSIEQADFNPPQSEVTFIQGRGPFSTEDEHSLLREERIDLLVSKNSGGKATYAKIEAARSLNLPVIMIERPAVPDCICFSEVEELLTHLGL